MTGAEGRSGRKAAGKLISKGAEQRLREAIHHRSSVGWKTVAMKFALDDDADSFLRGYISSAVPEKDRRINDTQIEFIEKLQRLQLISYDFSDYLIFGSASRDPEIAGIKGAFIGSMLTLAVCLVVSVPDGCCNRCLP